MGQRSSGNNCPWCRASKGELRIKEHLDKLGVYYKSQFKFKNCKYTISLPFDFVILPKGRDPIIVEYQGIQHYEAKKHFGGEEGLVKRQLHDQIKRDFATRYNLPYLEIPYTEKNNIPKLLDDFIASSPPRRNLK